MKLTKTKGSNQTLESGICCLCRWSDETHWDQRQQSLLKIKILLPLPLTSWNSRRSKAAIWPWNQEFAASAVDPMKLTKTKGSNQTLESRICCLCRWPDETREDRRQQSDLGIKNLLPLPLTRWNSRKSKAATRPLNQEFAASALDPMKFYQALVEFHRVKGRGSKFLILWNNCYLWSSFIGSTAEAANSWFCGEFVAFANRFNPVGLYKAKQAVDLAKYHICAVPYESWIICLEQSR